MSDFDDEFTETAMPDFFERMGDEVIFVDANGVETTLTAVLGPEAARDVPNRNGFERVRWRTITISRDPAGDYGGVENPATNGHFEIDGEEWSIDGVAKTPGEITLEIYRSAVVEIGPKNHQRGRR